MGRWRESRGVRCRREGRSSIECMFDLGGLAAVDPDADEAALIGRIAWLEQAKSAAAAGQARAAAALDEKRRAEEAAAGVPKAKQCRGVAGIWVSVKRWCARCRIRWRPWSVGRSRSGARR
jgi:hypothetical protein